jgi:hypothetical protein
MTPDSISHSPTSEPPFRPVFPMFIINVSYLYLLSDSNILLQKLYWSLYGLYIVLICLYMFYPM